MASVSAPRSAIPPDRQHHDAPQAERGGEHGDEDQRARDDDPDEDEVGRGPQVPARGDALGGEVAVERGERAADRVEARLAERVEVVVDRAAIVPADRGDDDLGIAAAPRFRVRADPGEVGRKLPAAAAVGEALEVGERLARGGDAGPVGLEEDVVAGQRIAAHRGLLVQQRGLQAQRRDERGIDAVDDARAGVGVALEREQRDDRADDRDRRQHEHRADEPLHDGEAAQARARGVVGRRGHVGRYVRSSAPTSSGSGPPCSDSAYSTSAGTMLAASSVDASSAVALSARRAEPRRSSVPSTCPSMRPSV
jgi:hypothetical protein